MKKPLFVVPPWHPDTGPEKAREIQRLAEIQLEDVVTLATSGDGRAATLAAGMSAIAAGLLAAAVAVLGFNYVNGAAVIALIVSSAAFITAAALAVISTVPTAFYVRGYDPVLLIPHPGTEEDVIKWSVQELAKKLNHNGRVLHRQATLMWWSYGLAAAGIVLPLLSLIAIYALASPPAGTAGQTAVGAAAEVPAVQHRSSTCPSSHRVTHRPV